MVDSPAPGTLHDQGTISGEPFGDGTIDLLVTFGDESTATGTFTIDAPGGSAFGTVGDDLRDHRQRDRLHRRRPTFTGGTGKFRGIKGEDLAAHDHNTLDGQNGTYRLDGFVQY